MNIKNKIWFKTALLSISLVLTSASAISAIIPMMLNQLPGVSSSLIESIVTIPSFSMMLFVLLSGPISSRLGKKYSPARTFARGHRRNTSYAHYEHYMDSRVAFGARCRPGDVQFAGCQFN